jgi:cytosine/adenosine deaminase-related metal-dependent hydrolase
MVTEAARPALLLRRARCFDGRGFGEPREVVVDGEAVASQPTRSVVELDLGGRCLLPALVNAHDVLDLASLPPLGAAAPYASVYEWTRDSEAEMAGHAAALAVPLADRLFLGAMRNLLAGVASVLHHHPDHRSLARDDFPVRVQRRYAFAHSPGLTPELRRTYRTSDRRIPWIVRAGEGSDPALRAEIQQLARANVLRQNTVVARGTALEAADASILAAARASLSWSPECDLRQYGRTAPVPALAAAGVRSGLGSDGAPAGSRDFLSTLAAARRIAAFDAAEALAWATQRSAEVARMPLGGCLPGDAPDLLATASPERLSAGERGAVDLLLVRGRVLYGTPDLVSAALPAAVRFELDGEPRAMEASLGRRLRGLLRRHPSLSRALWLATLEGWTGTV